MAKETLQFRCPACGAHSNIDRLTSQEEYEFEIFRRVIGGKLALTEAEKILKHGEKPRRGSGHGGMRYERQGDFARGIYLFRMVSRLELALERCRAMVAEAERHQ